MALETIRWRLELMRLLPIDPRLGSSFAATSTRWILTGRKLPPYDAASPSCSN